MIMDLSLKRKSVETETATSSQLANRGIVTIGEILGSKERSHYRRNTRVKGKK